MALGSGLSSLPGGDRAPAGGITQRWLNAASLQEIRNVVKGVEILRFQKKVSYEKGRQDHYYREL